MNLVKASDSFYYKDFARDGITYRIFNYRLASYTEFLRPDALECRGVMFVVNPELNLPVRLACWPQEKFFNLNENPLTMNLDLNQAVDIELKVDGSLISTYMHGDVLGVKSKGSIESEQCIAASKWLALPENKIFLEELKELTRAGYTVNMEWCAPDNRIVIGYEEPHLRVLNIRNNKDGSYLQKIESPEILLRFVDKIAYDDPVQFVHDIPSMTGVEGYIVRLASGIRVKVKTEWYLTQHRAKDSIHSPRRLFEAVLEESSDDLRSLFYDDPVVIARIDEMESFVEKLYNNTVAQVESFYEKNKHLERKDYAILGQQELDPRIFSLAMNAYCGHEIDYKAFLRKNYKKFGIKDEDSTQNEE